MKSGRRRYFDQGYPGDSLLIIRDTDGEAFIQVRSERDSKEESRQIQLTVRQVTDIAAFLTGLNQAPPQLLWADEIAMDE